MNKNINKNNKKVAFYLLSLFGGGGQKVILDLAKGFSLQGYKVDLLLFSRKGNLLSRIDSRINIIDLGSKRILFSVFPIIKYLKNEKPLFVMGTSEHANLVLILAKLFSRTKTKVLVRVGMTFFDLFKNYKKKRDRLIPLLIKLLYPYADKIIANSQNVAHDLEKVSKLPKNKIQIIYNPKFVEEIKEKSLDRFANARKDGLDSVSSVTNTPQSSLRGTRQSRKQSNWDFPDKFTILAVGRLEKQKDFKILIRAFALVKRKIDAQLIILGEGGQRKELEEMILALDLKDVFLKGFTDNPYFYMANADILVSTSLWEGFSNVLIEAGILGLPILATDCGSGSRELLAPHSNFNKQLEKGRIEYADNGILVAKQDKEMIAKAIILLFEDEELRKEYSEKIKGYSGEFGIMKILEKYKEII